MDMEGMMGEEMEEMDEEEEEQWSLYRCIVK